MRFKLNNIIPVVLLTVFQLAASCNNHNVVKSENTKEEFQLKEPEINFMDYSITNPDESLIYSQSKDDFAQLHFSTDFDDGTMAIVRLQKPANTVDEKVLKKSFHIDSVEVINGIIEVPLSHYFINAYVVFDVYRSTKSSDQKTKNMDHYHREFHVDYLKKQVNGINQGIVLKPLGVYVREN